MYQHCHIQVDFEHLVALRPSRPSSEVTADSYLAGAELRRGPCLSSVSISSIENDVGDYSGQVCSRSFRTGLKSVPLKTRLEV